MRPPRGALVGSARTIRSPAKSWVSAGYENANLAYMQLTDQVRELLQGAFPSGEVEVSSFSGSDHLSARVRSDRFAGLSLIEQHRLVYAPVQHLISDGTIHALQIKTEAT
jgi:acid stress-induced BolA-like protein IbaG/YrbA